MMETVIKTLFMALTRPESFVLFAWVIVEKYSSWRNQKADAVIIKNLMLAQQENSNTLAKLGVMIESMFRSSGR